MKYPDDASDTIENKDDINMGRRQALTKLGLMAVATYAAPLMLKISDAHAKGGSGGGSGGHGGSGGSSGSSGASEFGNGDSPSGTSSNDDLKIQS